MKTKIFSELPKLPKLKLAVVGHVEWMSFLSVNQYPKAGTICHGKEYLKDVGGGGAVAAINLSRITGSPVHFFTSLGKDMIGERSYKRLCQLGLIPKVAWRDKPTRKGISMINSNGERSITVIGERLQPCGQDPLPWNELKKFDGIFVTATDEIGVLHCREAKVLTATPRIGAEIILSSKVIVDVLIGSALDQQEQREAQKIFPLAKIQISTQGERGGIVSPGGRYEAKHIDQKPIDSYGCGDTFAAAVTAGISAGWNIEKAISLGCHYGAECVSHLGPYPTTGSRRKSNYDF